MNVRGYDAQYWARVIYDVVDVLFDVEEPYHSRFVVLLGEWARRPHWANGNPPERRELVDWLKWHPFHCLFLTRLLRTWTRDERL